MRYSFWNHMQVVSEPGAENALEAEWADKLVFAEGVDGLMEALQPYLFNETARLQRHAVGWDFAKNKYALEPFINEYLL